MANAQVDSPVSAAAGKIKNKKLSNWVEEVTAMCRPDRVHLCDGSDQEYQQMIRIMLQSGTAISLNPQKRPIVFTSVPRPLMLHVSKIVLLSVPKPRAKPAPITTGKIRCE